MKIEITYKCGHKGTIEVYGKSADREKAIYNAEHYEMCPECSAKAIAEKGAAAASANKAAGMADLKGSEKQVAWAEAIRAKIMADIEALPAAAGAAAALKAKVIAHYKAEDSARVWIDLRNASVRDIVAAATK